MHISSQDMREREKERETQQSSPDSTTQRRLSPKHLEVVHPIDPHAHTARPHEILHTPSVPHIPRTTASEHTIVDKRRHTPIAHRHEIPISQTVRIGRRLVMTAMLLLLLMVERGIRRMLGMLGMMLGVVRRTLLRMRMVL